MNFHKLHLEGACLSINVNAEHCSVNRQAVPEYRMEHVCLPLFKNGIKMQHFAFCISGFCFQPLSHDLSGMIVLYLYHAQTVQTYLWFSPDCLHT